MSSSTTSSKKPRARKLERDRARNKSEGKKTSTRHEAAKKAAADKRKKPALKVRVRADREVATVAKSSASKSDRKKTKSKEIWNPSGKSTRKNSYRSAKEAQETRQQSRRPKTATRYEKTDRYQKPVRERPARERFVDEKPAREKFARAPKETRVNKEARRPIEVKRNEVREPRKSVIETKPTRVTEKLAPIDLPAWSELGVHKDLLPVLQRQGIETPFPIQIKTLPDTISGRDVLGRGQTGSGKTLAFGLAMLTKLANRKATKNHPLGLVLVPTRELAMQVTDALKPLAQAVDLDIRLIAGGMPYAKQIEALNKSVPILVATPGRLNDLIEQGYVNLSKTEITILDEADQMCDMGFYPQIVEVLDLTKPNTQRLLFSATLDRDVDQIVKKYLTNPVEHATDTAKASVKTMDHYLFVVYREDKEDVLAEIGAREGKTIFFARTQLGVERIAKDLAKRGVAAGALHGGKTQGARTRTLAAFKEGLTNVLVATDVAARGIHVDGVSLVVHVDPPADPKDYLHRAGRTARAGESGAVVTMVTPRQQKSVEQMTKRAGVEPKVVRVKPMSKDLVTITGAKKPSGVPWIEPAPPKGSRGRGRGNPSAGGGSRNMRRDSASRPRKSR